MCKQGKPFLTAMHISRPAQTMQAHSIRQPNKSLSRDVLRKHESTFVIQKNAEEMQCTAKNF